MSYQRSVIEYFRDKADAYDLVDEQAYWRLSDTLLREVLERDVLDQLPDGLTFLDAGGGTGRWSEAVLSARPRARGVLYDLSPDMLRQAKSKAHRKGFAERLELLEGRLEVAGERLAGRSFDLVFNFHNVLGFVEDADAVIGQLAGLLRPGGRLVSFVPNRYHAAFFNVAQGRLDEARQALVESRGRFTTDMPSMTLFTPESLRALYLRHSLEVEWLTGFPTVIYPGHQETQLRGQTESLAELLERPSCFARVVELERAALREPGIAARGNNLFVVGMRRAD